eukprot:gene14416-20419_t
MLQGANQALRATRQGHKGNWGSARLDPDGKTGPDGKRLDLIVKTGRERITRIGKVNRGDKVQQVPDGATGDKGNKVQTTWNDGKTGPDGSVTVATGDRGPQVPTGDDGANQALTALTDPPVPDDSTSDGGKA